MRSRSPGAGRAAFAACGLEGVDAPVPALLAQHHVARDGPPGGGHLDRSLRVVAILLGASGELRLEVLGDLVEVERPHVGRLVAVDLLARLQVPVVDRGDRFLGGALSAACVRPTGQHENQCHDGADNDHADAGEDPRQGALFLRAVLRTVWTGLPILALLSVLPILAGRRVTPRLLDRLGPALRVATLLRVAALWRITALLGGST